MDEYVPKQKSKGAPPTLGAIAIKCKGTSQSRNLEGINFHEEGQHNLCGG